MSGYIIYIKLHNFRVTEMHNVVVNKSNATAGDVRVEANLPGTSAACTIFVIANA